MYKIRKEITSDDGAAAAAVRRSSPLRRPASEAPPLQLPARVVSSEASGGWLLSGPRTAQAPAPVVDRPTGRAQPDRVGDQASSYPARERGLGASLGALRGMDW